MLHFRCGEVVDGNRIAGCKFSSNEWDVSAVCSPNVRETVTEIDHSTSALLPAELPIEPRQSVRILRPDTKSLFILFRQR